MVGIRDSDPETEQGSARCSHTTVRLPPIYLADIDPECVVWQLKDVYAEALHFLIASDAQGTFSSTADHCPVVEYDRAIKKPMDFTIMCQKLEAMVYLDDPSLFDEDIALIVNNMKKYNPPTSQKYQAAVALERLYGSIRHKMFKRIFNILEQASKKGTQHATRSRATSSTSRKEEQKSEEGSTGSTYMDPTSAFNNRPRRRYPFPETQHGKSHMRPPRTMNPIIFAVNQTMNGDSSAWERVGTCLNSPGGLNRALNSIEAMYARLLETPYAKMTWFKQLTEPYTRILKEFEYRKFAANLRTSDSVDPRACSLLMNRLRTGNYKDSILNFVGYQNIRKLNAMFPKLMDTLNDLHVNPHLVATTMQLKF